MLTTTKNTLLNRVLSLEAYLYESLSQEQDAEALKLINRNIGSIKAVIRKAN